MELIVNKDTVNVCETIYDGYTEQGVEFDYVLPDYYPDIFRIVKCSLNPGIVSYSVSGAQLVCDGVVYIKVLYTAEGSRKINCVEHRYTYSKTVELPSAPDKPMVKLLPKADYCNCRAVSGRRLDVRGAISCKVKVTGCGTRELITDISGGSIEKRADAHTYCTEKLYASRQFVSREDIEAGTGSISCIISHCCTVSAAEVKIVADKAVVKAEATLKALYLVDKGDGDEETQAMEAAIPLSQIIDVAGLTSSHLTSAAMRILDCDIEAKQDSEDGTRIIACDLTVDCCVTACMEGEMSPISDLYSTEYETDFRSKEIRVEHTPQRISEQAAAKLTIECGDEPIGEIRDARCEISGVNSVVDEANGEQMKISGQCAVQLVCRRDDGEIFFIDKTAGFDTEVNILPVDAGCVIDTDVSVSDCSYSISSDNTVDIRLQLLISGNICCTKSIPTVSDISVNDDMPKLRNDDYAVKLYYADENEDVWGIAKRYNTSVGQIAAENELESDILTEPRMLLIPIS